MGVPIHQQDIYSERDKKGDQRHFPRQTALPIHCLPCALEENLLKATVTSIDSSTENVRTLRDLDQSRHKLMYTQQGDGAKSHREESRVLKWVSQDETTVDRFFPEYKLRKPSFFTVGRVFSTVWSEPAGASGSDIMTNFTYAGGNETTFSKIRRFVVIREDGHHCCAIPITTYAGQGVGRRGVKKANHAIIHTGAEAPKPSCDEMPGRGESPMRLHAIRVVPSDPAERLHPMSRLDFSKIYTIEHNVRVQSFGKVHETSMQNLLTQFNNVFTPGDWSWSGLSPSALRQRHPTTADGPKC